MRRYVCLLALAEMGLMACGSDNKGGGGSGGFTVPDAGGGSGGPGGTSGMGGSGGSGGGPANGTQLSDKGASQVLVSKDQTMAAFLDIQSNQAHVVPIAGGTVIDFPYNDLVQQGAIGWVQNTLLI